MLGINRKNGRLALAVLAGLGLATWASPARASTVLYQTGFNASDNTGTITSGPFTNGNTFTDPGPVDGLTGHIAGTASGSITNTNLSAYTGNAYSSPGTVNQPSWQGAPAFTSQALQLNRSDASAVGVSPDFHSVTNVASASQNTTITVSTYVGSVPAVGTGSGPFVGINLFGNNDAVEIGAFGIDEATGNVVYSLNGTNFTDTNISEGPLATNGEYDQLQLVAAFLNGNGVNAGSVQLAGYVDGALAFTGTSTNGALVNSFYHAYLWSGTLNSGTDTNSPYTAYFGDYEVTQSLSAVPEPTALGLIGVCGMMLAARRSRRSVAL